jgi:phage terminase large subunit GpA-like protein
MLTARQIVNEAWNSGLKPPPVLTVSQWADKYRIVAAPSPEPGEWRTDRTPYLRQIMDCLSPMAAARTVAVEKGSQLGATEAGLNWVGYKMHQYPSSFLIVLPTQGVAEEWSKTRLSQMVEHSPELAGLLAPQKSRDSGNTIFNKKVRGGKGLIKFAWSSSAAKQRSTPADDLLLDEVDGFEGDVEGEGDPVTGLKRRFTNFPRGKMLMISTPTGASTSRIHREFLAGDRRYYFMPCPHCGHYQRFVFRANLKWPKPVEGETPNERDARYSAVGLTCVGCAQSIPERFKPQMLARGTFVATVTCTGKEGQRPEIADAGFAASDLESMAPIFAEMQIARWVSFHLPAGLSPLGWYSWSTMASDWEAVQGKRDVNALKVFVNQVLGEVWEDERGDAPDDEKIWLRREHYPYFSTGAGGFPWNEDARVPHRGMFLTAAVDIQQNPARLEVGVKAWGRGKEAWHIGYWVFRGDVSRVENEPWQMLDTLLAMKFLHEGGQPLYIMAMAIDTGYLAPVVYQFAMRHPSPAHSDATGSSVTNLGTVIPTAGTDDWLKIVSSVTKSDAARRRQNVRIWKVGGHFAKTELYGWLRLPVPESDSTPSPGYQHYPDYQRAWFAGLCSEQRIVRNGKAHYEIIPGHERNEPLDTEQYNRLAIAVCGIDNPTMFTEKMWREMEAHCHVASPVAMTERSAPKPQAERKDGFIPKRSWF